MPRSKHIIYCWDTSVILAWLCEDESYPLDDIDLVVREVDRGAKAAASLLFSVTTVTELLEIIPGADAIKLFEQFCERRNVRVANIDLAIASKARSIRIAAQATRRKLKTPDAQVVATAINYRADVLHTFDKKLLTLSGSEVVDGLQIVTPRPWSGHQSLFSQ